MTGSAPPRVLVVTRNYPPLTGGMERLLHNMSAGLAEYTSLTLVGPSGCGAFAPKGTRVYESQEKLVPFLFFSMLNGIRARLFGKYDVIIGGSGLTAPALTLLRALFGGKTVLLLHGLDLVVDNQWYQRAFVPCIRRADKVIANSKSTRDIAIAKGVSPETITIINPGTNLPDLEKIGSHQQFCRQYQLKFSKTLLFAGRMTRRKGLSGFIKYSLPAILEAEPDCGLLVVGDNPDQGLTKMGEAEEVKQLIETMGLAKRVRFMGQLPDEELTRAFAHADVHIFPVIDVPGDIEGFGMVAVEAAACGTPTVAFGVGGVVDAVSDLNGKIVEPNKYEQFSEAVIRLMQHDKPSASMCIDHATQHRWELYNVEMRRILAEIA